MFLFGGVGDECLEDLFGWEADLARDGEGGEVTGIDLVRPQLIGDVQGVELAGGVGFHELGNRE